MASKLGADKLKAKRAGELLDAFASNILGFNDYPLEQLRKLSAVQTVMQKMGFANKRALDEFIEAGGKRARDAFETKVIMEFSNSGG